MIKNRIKFDTSLQCLSISALHIKAVISFLSHVISARFVQTSENILSKGHLAYMIQS